MEDVFHHITCCMNKPGEDKTGLCWVYYCFFSLGSNILQRHDRSRAWSSNLSLDCRGGRAVLTLSRPFTLRSGTTWHGSGHLFSDCEACLLHCHPYKLRNSSRGQDLAEICVQSSSKRPAAALQVPLCCRQISNCHY